MKKKFVIPMSLIMVAALSLPLYVLADSSISSSSTNSNITTTSDSSTSTDKDTSSTTSTASSSLSLSLEDALNRVEKGYNQIQLDDRYIDVLDKQYQEAIGYQKSIKENGTNNLTEDDAKILKLNVPVALLALNDQKHQREVDLRNAKVSVTNEYESILAAQLQIDLINQQISNLQKDMDSINAKIKAGAAKASDIEPDKAKMATLQASLSSTQNGIKSSMISLKDDLGIGLDTEITLTSKPMDYVKYDDTNLDEYIQAAIQNSYSIQSLKQNIENMKIQYDIYKQYYDSQKNTTEINIEDLQNQVNQAPNSIEVQIKTLYNTLKSKENTIEADKLSIEAAQISADTIQQTYNQGRATYLDVLNAQLGLADAKNTLQQDTISYMTALTNLQNSLEDQ